MLSLAHKQEVLALVREGLDSRLPPEKEARLRALVGHEVPSAFRASWEQVIETGTFMVGVWDFTGSLESEA